ncbi:MAG: ABC transporter ATP-binding protein [Deltaproteobacteria bacterium]|nr:ABC transporter ATP-binding protein [Deltaproteobacteria bacterium]
MSDAAISVRGLGKRYRIGARVGQYKRLTETVTDLFAAPFRRLARIGRAAPAEETIWALRDVSFDVEPGEVIGVIGRNGAGKSTLLKVLSRITEPTAGEALIRGRVGSLLEVGTGFHPELTGRENIFLNGAILGMRKKEIERKFDEILDFAEIEKFVDTPVKRYSSGMYVRLAFAVAAHLETDILFVDEVLAVGDAQFQKKCLGKMGTISTQGRTVVLVSHNLASIRALSNRCLLLNQGRVEEFGDTGRVVTRYSQMLGGLSRPDPSDLEPYRRSPVGDAPVRFVSIAVRSATGAAVDFPMASDITIVMEIDAARSLREITIAIAIKNADGLRVALLFTGDSGRKIELPAGRSIVETTIKRAPMAPGLYSIDAGLNRSTRDVAYDVILDLPLFEISNPPGRDSSVGEWLDRPWGVVHLDNVEWQILPKPDAR